MEIICLYGSPDSGKTEVLNILAKKMLEENGSCNIFPAINFDRTKDIVLYQKDIENFLSTPSVTDRNLILEWNSKKIGFAMKGDNPDEIDEGLNFIRGNGGVDILLIATRRKGSSTYYKVEEYARKEPQTTFYPHQQKKIRYIKENNEITKKNNIEVNKLYEDIESKILEI